MNQKRGAPLGNRNAYKHGFYSAGFKAAERQLLAEMPPSDLAAEIELIRVTSLRFLEALNNAAQPMAFETQLAALRAINLSAHSIVSLMRVQAITASARQAADELTQALQSLEAAPPE